MFGKIFKKKKKDKKLYFALVISDRPADGFQFTPDTKCKVFLFNGEVDPDVVIPQMTLKTAVDKFGVDAPEVEGSDIKITEKKI